MSRDCNIDKNIDERDAAECREKREPGSRMALSQGRAGGSGSEKGTGKQVSDIDLAALRERIDLAAEGHPSVTEFLDRLEKLGVRPIASIQSSGRWNGIVYEYCGSRVKGSNLGRAYTAKGLQQRKGVCYEPVRDDERLARSSSNATPVLRSSPDRSSEDARDVGVKNLDRASRLRDPDGISPAQRALLWEVGRFRTVAAADLEQARYHGHASLLHQDLKLLIAQRLIERRTIAVNSRGKTMTVLALTRRGKALLKRSVRGQRDTAQALYTGFVKPREVVHDAALYRMYLAEAERIEREGGRIQRVVLDYELKKRAYSPLAKAHDLPPLAYAERQQQIADENGLQVVDGHIVLPDLRIEYETREGEERHIDLELATRNYRSAHVRSKAAAGFKFYADTSSGALFAVLDDHDLIAELLRL